ncbi:MarC family NAAT transporter [Sphingomonas daechungensis]|uniref:MarC family NAAT transporter n=1 Tax=Sphingomonas daechungensis TaxID=1176646 RepID=UPI003784391B
MEDRIFVDAIILTIGALFPVMNPMSVAPVFLSLTAAMDEQTRNRQARLACIYAFAILATFLLLGAAIISFFGISVAGIRVAGGLIVSLIGLRMLFSEPPEPDSADSIPAPAGGIAFTPLAMPGLAGPGSISVVVATASQIGGRTAESYVVYSGTIIGIAITVLIAWLVLRTATTLGKLMGPSSIDAMTRIFGFLLVCIGVQFLLTGIGDFYGLSIA